MWLVEPPSPYKIEKYWLCNFQNSYTFTNVLLKAKGTSQSNPAPMAKLVVHLAGESKGQY